MGVGGCAGATLEASHAEMPTFAEDAAVEGGEDNSTEDPPRVLSYSKAPRFRTQGLSNAYAFE